MSIEYDPNKAPQASPEMYATAHEYGLQVAYVICDDPTGDNGGVSFASLVPFLPRGGDRIKLENGRHCQVKRAYFNVCRMNGHVGMVPTIYATLLAE